MVRLVVEIKGKKFTVILREDLKADTLRNVWNFPEPSVKERIANKLLLT